MVTLAFNNFRQYLAERLAQNRGTTTVCDEVPVDLLADRQVVEQQDYNTPVFWLSVELLIAIFGYLKPKDLCNVAQVCVLWRRVSEDKMLWKLQIELECHKWSCLSNDTFIYNFLKEPACHNSRSYLSSEADSENDITMMTQNVAMTTSQEVGMTEKQSLLRCARNHVLYEDKCQPRQLRLMTILNEYVIKKYPKFAALGPGLERKGTGSIVRKMVEDSTKEFEPIRLLPGSNGVGSVLTFKMTTNLTRSASGSLANLDQTRQPSQATTITPRAASPDNTLNSSSRNATSVKISTRVDNFDFVTLYSNSSGVRERLPDQTSRLRFNGLVKNLYPEDIYDADKIHEPPEIFGVIRDLMKTLDGFIYVIDATDLRSEISLARLELEAFVKEFAKQDSINNNAQGGGSMKSNRPIMVMSLVRDEKVNKRSVSAFDLARVLQLDKMFGNKGTAPWYVYNCSVKQLDSVCQGFVWLIEKVYETKSMY